jgi:hypothetical protein
MTPGSVSTSTSLKAERCVREDNADTLYEDVLMPVGFTHDPFFTVAGHGKFSYPWHRYFADTDCVWMAIELHPL